MNEPSASLQPASRPWYLSFRVHQVLFVLLMLLLAVEGYLAIFHKTNDFNVHLQFGDEYLKGRPYGHGLDTYPVPRMMFNGALALLPPFWARGLCYLVAVVSLFSLYSLWSKLAEGMGPAPAKVDRAAALLVTFGFCTYLLRDLDECGLQLFLLLFLTAAAWSLVNGRNLWAGFWLATSIAYKVSPVLFVPFLLWKRQWKAVGYTVAFSALWAIVPALTLGWDSNLENHQRWLARVRQVGAVREAYPSLQELEPPKPQNLSLMAAFARWVETYPEDHPLFREVPWLPHHPWFVQFGNLDPESAYLTVRGIMLGLGLAFAWCWRRSWADQSLARNLPHEWAGVTMLIALFAPQCWKQHLVVVLPAAFLLLRQEMLTASRFHWRLFALSLVMAAALLLRNDLIGQRLGVLFLFYKVDSFACLLLLFMTTTLPTSIGEATTSIQESPPRPDSVVVTDASEPSKAAA